MDEEDVRDRQGFGLGYHAITHGISRRKIVKNTVRNFRTPCGEGYSPRLGAHWGLTVSMAW